MNKGFADILLLAFFSSGLKAATPKSFGFGKSVEQMLNIWLDRIGVNRVCFLVLADTFVCCIVCW